MTHTPLPPTAKLLQAILSRLAVEATESADYYAIGDIAYGASLLADGLLGGPMLRYWLKTLIADTNELAAALVARRNHD